MLTLAIALSLIALLAFANGSNDVSKSVATLVGSGVADYRRALRWGTAWTVTGGMLGGLLGLELAQRFAKSLGTDVHHQAAIPLAVVIASLGWIALASRMGLPVSTTHAITGAVLGVGWAAQGLSPWVRTDILQGFLVPLLVSPLLALALTFTLSPIVAVAWRRLATRCACLVPTPETAKPGGGASAVASPTLRLIVDRTTNCESGSVWSSSFPLDQAHWVSSGLVALSRGMNDAPKIWALSIPLFLLGEAHSQLWLPLATTIVALSMGLGSWIAGRKVTEVLAQRVTRMNQQEAFMANLSTALLVVIASQLGLPVSTTHVSSGTIVAVGLGRGRRDICWPVLAEMATAWVVTLPVAAILAVICYGVLN